MFNLILFGPPGSGKGTQSEKLIAKYHLKHLSTGDLLRSEISKKTSLGLEAKKYMDKGHLVPDQVVIGMINMLWITIRMSQDFYLMAFHAPLYRLKNWMIYYPKKIRVLM